MFKGEDIVNDHVWICNSTYPLTEPSNHPQKVNKVICLVRNPLDAIVSQFHLMMTWTLDKVPEGECHLKFPDHFDRFVKEKI